MGILGIGVDVVYIPRFLSLTSRRSSDRFASRILSATEVEDWHMLKHASLEKQSTFLAVRWGLKEAAYKAMFPKLRPTWKELTYRGLDRQLCRKPILTYNPSKDNKVVGDIHCSVSHDGDYVFTTVLIEDK